MTCVSHDDDDDDDDDDDGKVIVGGDVLIFYGLGGEQDEYGGVGSRPGPPDGFDIPAQISSELYEASVSPR
jgi:hypothetical protein